MDELIELAIEAGFDTFSPNSIDDDIVICTYCGSSINEKLVKFAGLIEAKQAERITEIETKLYHAELAAEAEAKEVDKRGKRIAKLEAALEKAVNICDELEAGYLNLGHTAAQEAMLCAATSDMRESIRALINNAKNAQEALED